MSLLKALVECYQQNNYGLLQDECSAVIFFHLHPLILKAKAELAAARSINKDSGNEEKEEKEGKEE